MSDDIIAGLAAKFIATCIIIDNTYEQFEIVLVTGLAFFVFDELQYGFNILFIYSMI